MTNKKQKKVKGKKGASGVWNKRDTSAWPNMLVFKFQSSKKERAQTFVPDLSLFSRSRGKHASRKKFWRLFLASVVKLGSPHHLLINLSVNWRVINFTQRVLFSASINQSLVGVLFAPMISYRDFKYFLKGRVSIFSNFARDDDHWSGKGGSLLRISWLEKQRFLKGDELLQLFRNNWILILAILGVFYS